MILGSVAASAGNVTFSIAINSNGVVGSGTGTYSPTLGKAIFSGSVHSSSPITSGYLLESDNTTQLPFTITGNGTGNYAFHFTTNPSTVLANFQSNITHYVATFFNGSSVVVTSPAKLGTPSVVPETQTYAMVAGAALLGFAAFRRARR